MRRLLRNPIVSGLLAIAAVLVLAYQFNGGALARFRPAGIAQRVIQQFVSVTTPAPPPQSPVATESPEPAAPLPSDANVDQAYLEARFAKWVVAPMRDPFLLFASEKDRSKEEEEFASPISKWKLNGIWDQTGGKLAVINKRVHKVGDEIEGYKIIRIEGEEVWFQGPKRKERLALEKRGPAVLQIPVFPPATNPPPSSIPE